MQQMINCFANSANMVSTGNIWFKVVVKKKNSLLLLLPAIVNSFNQIHLPGALISSMPQQIHGEKLSVFTDDPSH